MTKLEIFNRVLDIFGFPQITDNELQFKESREVRVIDLHYPNAIQKVSLENCWTYLNELIEKQPATQSIEETTSGVWEHTSLYLGDDLGPKAGYEHSYQLSKDILRLTEVKSHGKGARRVGNILLSNDSDVTVFAQIKPNIVPENPEIPEEFWILVTYQLAFLVSPSLTNSDTKVVQMVLSMYTDMLQTAMFNDLNQTETYNE